MTRYVIGLAITSILMIMGIVSAAEPSSTDRLSWPSLFIFENDVFAGTDKGYTNGAILSFSGPWMNTAKDDDSWLSAIVDGWSLIPREGRQERAVFTIGQMMITPDNIEAEQLIVDDIPYSGLLFGRFDYDYRNDEEADSFSILMGVIGPSSGAEETQTFVHKMVDSPKPKGWDNQLKDEFALNLNYEHKWHVVNTFPNGHNGYGFDLTGYAGLGLGNVLTDAKAGLIARYGLSPSLFPQSIYKGGLGSVPDLSVSKPGWSWSVVAGVEGCYLAHSVFLDGNTFKDSHSVDRIPEQGSIFGGIGLSYGRFHISMFMLRGTEKFESQRGRTRYGSLTVGWVF